MPAPARRASATIRRLLRGLPPPLRRRPAAVQARPDGAAHPLLRATARGTTACAATCRAARASRPSSTRFLDRVTINVSAAVAQPRAVGTLAAPRSCPSWPAPAASRRWSAGCSYGAEAYTLAAVCRDARSRAPASTIRGTDIDRRMVERARERPLHRPRTPAACRRATLARHFERPTAAATARRGAARASCASSSGDLLRDRCRAGRLRPGPLPQHRHLLHRATCATRCTARLARRPAPRRRPRRRRDRARRRTRAAWASSPTHPFIYRKA